MDVRQLALLLPLAASFTWGAACEPAVPVGAGRAPQTSRLGISADGKTLYVALADHDLVRAIDAASGEVRGEVAVAGTPHRLTVLHDGRVAVTARSAGTLSILDVEAGRVEASVDVGADPFGVLEVDGSVLVAVAGERDLARVSLAEPGRVAARIPLPHDDPRGLALTDDGKVLVSHFTAGALSVVRGDEVTGDIDMHLPSKASFFPNQLDAVTVSPDGSELAVPHVECNNDPAQFGAAGTDLAGQLPTSVAYYIEGPTGYPAVVPAVSAVDTAGEILLSDEDRPLEEAMGTVPERMGATAPVLNPVNRSVLGAENVNSPSAVAYADDGALRLVVNRGSGNVLVQRARLERGQSSLVAVMKVGVGAEAIQLSPQGDIAYVYNAFDDSITSFPIARAPEKGSRYASESVVALTVVQPLARHTAAAPVLPEAVRRGRELFHAVDDRLTRFGAISCASCHPGGADDGTTWSFAEGPRQSPALWGGVAGTEPLHWDGAVVDMADISRATIQGRMGGTGLPRDDMNAIGAFLGSIPVPAPPRTADVGSIARGEQLFFSEATQCATCHSGGAFTDNTAHDVGTGPGNTARETLAAFATPVLRGLAHSGPYLHDGSAHSLRDVVDRLVATNLMGQGAHLSEQDKVDLVAFLEQL